MAFGSGVNRENGAVLKFKFGLVVTVEPAASKMINSMYYLFQVKRDRIVAMASAPVSRGEASLLRSISDGTASVTGTRFYRALVKNLSQALVTRGAWVTEHLPELGRLRALAFWLGDESIEHHEYALTAFEKICPGGTRKPGCS
jgi:hypothetical protein